jgi:hypothetical protein
MPTPNRTHLILGHMSENAPPRFFAYLPILRFIVQFKLLPPERSLSEIGHSGGKNAKMDVDDMRVEPESRPAKTDSWPHAGSCRIASAHFNPAASYIAACIEKMEGDLQDDLAINRVRTNSCKNYVRI